MSLVFWRHLRKRFVLPVFKYPNVEKISGLQLPIVGRDRCRRVAKTIVKHQRTFKGQNRLLKRPLSEVSSRKRGVGEDLHVRPVRPQLQQLEAMWALGRVTACKIDRGRFLAGKHGAGEHE